jgi:hypothetical protein
LREYIKTPQEFDLSRSEIESQPARVYTLQVALYKRKSGVRWFLSRFWSPNHMQRRGVYRTVPKNLQLFGGGDVDSKGDPLYAVWNTVKKRKMACVRYGIYESVADADQDQRILERHLGLRLQVLPCQLTKNLINKLWFIPDERYADDLDEIINHYVRR